LPINGKIPPMEQWQLKTTTNADEIALWPTMHPAAQSTGMLTARTPAIDFDILDPDAADATEHLAREHFGDRGKFLVRIGRAPKRAVLFRTETPFKKLTLPLQAPNGALGKIEILGDGQQIVVHGLHVDTRQPYAWFGGEPWTIAASELPLITEAEARTFLADAFAILESEYGYRRGSRTKADGTAPEPGESRGWADFLDGITQGRDLHDSTASLAAKLVTAGMSDGAAINLIRGLYDISVAPRDGRFRDRYFDIVRAVDSAREKFGAAAPDQAPVAYDFGWALKFFGEQMTMPTPKWLVTGLLPESGAALIAGQWGTYKTFCAFDLAAAVMSGNQFANFQVVERRGVALLCTEGSHEVELRITAAWHAHSNSGRAPFVWTTDVPRLLDRKAGKILTAMIKHADARMRAVFGLPVGLVLIDALGKAVGYQRSGDENDAAVVKTVMQALGSAATATNTPVLGVTHFGKNIETGTRGSTAFEDDADTVLALIGERTAGGTMANARLCLRKLRAALPALRCCCGRARSRSVWKRPWCSTGSARRPLRRRARRKPAKVGLRNL
jgi:hypothetical protein